MNFKNRGGLDCGKFRGSRERGSIKSDNVKGIHKTGLPRIRDTRSGGYSIRIPHGVPEGGKTFAERTESR